MSDILIFPRHPNGDHVLYAERRRLMYANPPDVRPHLWATRERAAELLGCTTRTIDRHRVNRVLGYARGRIGSYAAAVRFWVPDITWLVGQQQPESVEVDTE